MKTSFIRITFLTFILALLFSSCNNIENLKMTGIKGANIKSFEKNKIILNVSLGIENPNGMRFKMINNSMDVTVNKTYLGTAKITNKLVIPRKSNEIYNFDVEIKMGQLAIGAVPSLIEMFKSKGVDVQLDGFVKGRAYLISKKVPIKITERVDFNKLSRKK